MYKIKPYRLEWRSHLNMQWMRLRDLDEHPGDGLEEFIKNNSWSGYFRLISQHVIEEVKIIATDSS